MELHGNRDIGSVVSGKKDIKRYLLKRSLVALKPMTTQLGDFTQHKQIFPPFPCSI